MLAAEVGDFALAETYLRESLEATFAAGSAQQSVLTLEVFAKLRSYQGRFREAGRLLGASEALRQRISTAKHHAAAERLANILETARKSGVSDTVILEAMDDGRPLSEAEVIAEVLSEPADDHAAA